MSSIVLEIGIILVLLLVNGVFAMSEMAVVAARKTRLEHRAEGGDAGASAALDLAAHPTNFLSTVQVGITLVGILAGAFGGAGIAERLAVLFREVAWLSRFADAAALGIVVVAITYLSLIIGELVPKRIALANPERVAALVARPMRIIAKVGSPLVRLLTASTNVVFRLIGLRTTSDSAVTEQDIRAMVEQAAESGAVAPVEHEIVENVFGLGDRKVASIMTPRLDLRWLDATRPPDELSRQLVAQLGDRQAPTLLVCDGTVEDVLGVVHAQDLLARSVAGDPLNRAALLAALHQPLFVPATMAAFALLQRFRETRQDVAIALDEFGGVQGMVEVGDIVEAIMGDLPTWGSSQQPEIAVHPEGGWLADGDASIEALDDLLDVDPTPNGGSRGFHTIGGLVLTTVGRVPRLGDAFEYAGHRIDVVAMEGRRVGSVRIMPTSASERER